METELSELKHSIVFFGCPPESLLPLKPLEFLGNCPTSVRAKFFAVAQAVAEAPPKKFAGGGYWEAMHGEMAGWFEIRLNGPSRRQFRFFCLIDHDDIDNRSPLLVVVAGLAKPFRTVFTSADYASNRKIGDAYLANNPRRCIE